MDNVALRQLLSRILVLKNRSLDAFRIIYVPTLTNDTFAIINTQASDLQAEHWIMMAIS